MARCLGFALLSGVAPASSQAPPPSVFSTDVRLAELRVPELSRAIRGQVSVTYADDGPRLALSSLDAEAPPPVEIRVSSARPPLRRGCVDLEVEDEPVANALGGGYGTFALGSSVARVDQDPGDEGRRVLRVRCNRRDGGCGLWIQLFDSRAANRTFLDASEIARLVFWARVGGGDYQLKLADAHLSRREDAVSVGSLAALSTGADMDGWRRVELPLRSLPTALARDSLATFALEAMAAGDSQAELARVQLCAAGAEPAELAAAQREPEPPPRTLHRALWVWNTAEILADSAAEQRFLEFVERGAFDRVFVQLAAAEGAAPDGGWIPFDGERLGRLNAELGRRGARVYALDGQPSYALPANHAGVLRTVQAVLEHNRTSPEERRFHGVRYDIEPYLLGDFFGPARDGLLTGFLDLLGAISERVEGRLRFGVDIPFWWDVPEAATGQRIALRWRGEQRTLLDHLLRQVDDVAVMAYRTSAYGADGTLALAYGELDAGAEAGAQVFVGVETERLPDEEAFAFRGVPSRGLPPSGVGPWLVGGTRADGITRFWLVPAAQPVWEPIVAAAGLAADDLRHWRTDPPARVSADRLSFHSLGSARLEAEAARIVRELGRRPAFAGLAFHHYGSLTRLSR